MHDTEEMPKGSSVLYHLGLQVGEEDTQAQLQLQMTYHDHDWVMLDPEEGRWQDGVPLKMTRTLKRRYYLVEKAKNANVIGHTTSSQTCPDLYHLFHHQGDKFHFPAHLPGS